MRLGKIMFYHTRWAERHWQEMNRQANIVSEIKDKAKTRAMR